MAATFASIRRKHPGDGFAKAAVCHNYEPVSSFQFPPPLTVSALALGAVLVGAPTAADGPQDNPWDNNLGLFHVRIPAGSSDWDYRSRRGYRPV
ncbi:hypothetical protein [Rhodococcus sp. H29-C3]|uniref:hypothetical protein n=1 Tax=Rhodococcus sp. H29-C3 TaxID=3046307 RepID=UPI0024B97DBC|nr:hypothetical protein [Rhodococcus sp. H29-C3]MDJ0362729.1 hypothetical protein [Rhodococcus sp. H29-C3]